MGQRASLPSVAGLHTHAPPSPLIQPPSSTRRVRGARHIARHLADFIARQLSLLWRLMRRLWLAAIVGGLIAAVATQIVVAGSPRLDGPPSFALVQAALARPDLSATVMAAGVLLLLLAYIADRRLRIAGLLREGYLMEQVDEVSTSTIRTRLRIARYVPDVYLPRRLRHHDTTAGQDADLAARIALDDAKRREPSSVAGSLGICVFGRPTQGKTRLAWEAVRTTLPNALLVKWPYHTPKVTFPYAAIAGRTVVLWLDDLVKYVSGSQLPYLLDLPTRFAKAHTHLVIVATCRSGHDEFAVRRKLGNLLNRLTPVRPVEMKESEATALARAFQQVGETVYTGERDMTPGSLLLGIDHMRDDIFSQLPQDAKRVLRAMKLLVSAGVHTYPECRVRAVASDPHLFGPLDSNWRDAIAAVAATEFIHLDLHEQGHHDQSTVTIEPVADVYLDEAIPDYPSHTTDGASEADDWPHLQRILTQQRDADALLSLGTAFTERLLGNRRENRERALACYQLALSVYTREQSPTGWATTQHNLAITLRALAEISKGHERVRLLSESVAAWRAALSVYTREMSPTYWARAQNYLGNTLSDEAELTMGTEREERAKRAQLLSEAIAAYSAALSVRTRERTPIAWAGTQYNLAQAHLQRAILAGDEGEDIATLGAELRAAHTYVQGARAVFAQTNAIFLHAADVLAGHIADALARAGCPAT